MNYINKYLRNFAPYKVASHKIWQVSREERREILKLDWNEATIEPAPEVMEGIKNLVSEENFLNYYPATYNQELLDLLSKYTDLETKYIQYFAGSDLLEEYISKLFITVGDPVLILWPSYDNFRLTAQVAGAHVMFFELNEDFSFDSKRFEDKIDRKDPSLVYICNPNNPTGLELSFDYIKYLIEKYSSTMFLIDEAYWEFSGNTCQELVKDHDNILIARTFSKAFALANVRFGYLIASRENIDFISAIRNPKNISTFAQVAAIGALSNVGYMQNYVNQVLEARVYFINAINEKCNPYFLANDSKANFVLVNCINHLVKDEMISCLERHNIFVRNVTHSKIIMNCIRITIGKKEQMERVVKCFIDYCEELNSENEYNETD